MKKELTFLFLVSLQIACGDNSLLNPNEETQNIASPSISYLDLQGEWKQQNEKLIYEQDSIATRVRPGWEIYTFGRDSINTVVWKELESGALEWFSGEYWIDGNFVGMKGTLHWHTYSYPQERTMPQIYFFQNSFADSTLELTTIRGDYVGELLELEKPWLYFKMSRDQIVEALIVLQSVNFSSNPEGMLYSNRDNSYRVSRTFTKR